MAVTHNYLHDGNQPQLHSYWMSYWLFILVVVWVTNITCMNMVYSLKVSNRLQSILVVCLLRIKNISLWMVWKTNRYCRNWKWYSLYKHGAFSIPMWSFQARSVSLFFLFFTQINYVNNKVYYRKIISPLNYITTWSFTPQICSVYLTMGL